MLTMAMSNIIVLIEGLQDLIMSWFPVWRVLNHFSATEYSGEWLVKYGMETVSTTMTLRCLKWSVLHLVRRTNRLFAYYLLSIMVYPVICG